MVLVISNLTFHNLLPFLSYKVSESVTYDEVTSYAAVFSSYEMFIIVSLFTTFQYLPLLLENVIEDIYIPRTLSTYFLTKLKSFCDLKGEGEDSYTFGKLFRYVYI